MAIELMFPSTRPRRLRLNDNIRALVQEHSLSVNDFIYPMFVKEGEGEIEPIASMPDVYRYSIDTLLFVSRMALGILQLLYFQ